tara:strand:+ start:1223 stop:1798 length:576 start_codon:yes stop_codon:yes gene_type:complete
MKTLLSIWIKPKKTFEYLEGRDESKNEVTINTLFFLISTVAGFSNMTDIAELVGVNYYIALPISLVFSGLIGMFVFNRVISLIIFFVSKLLQGKASKNEIRLVVAYSFIPHLVHLFIGLIMIAPAILLKDFDLLNYKNSITIFVISILTIRIFIFGLSHFNKFSYGYAVLNIFIPIAILQGILYSIKYLIM